MLLIFPILVYFLYNSVLYRKYIVTTSQWNRIIPNIIQIYGYTKLPYHKLSDRSLHIYTIKNFTTKDSQLYTTCYINYFLGGGVSYTQEMATVQFCAFKYLDRSA